MTPRIPDTTADARLSGLESFLEFWLGPRRPEYGEPAETLATMELPEPLRRFYAFAGRWPPAYPGYSNRFCVQDQFLPLDPAAPWGSVHRSGPYLVFSTENQGVWQVATLPEGDDPPVWVSEDYYRNPSPTWRQLDNPLSHFLVSFVLQELLLGAGFVAMCEDALTVFEGAGCRIEPIWLAGEYARPWFRDSYVLVDGCILLQHKADVALDDHWYGYNDPTAAEFVEGLGLPSKND